MSTTDTTSESYRRAMALLAQGDETPSPTMITAMMRRFGTPGEDAIDSDPAAA